jgi:hypothetical protein
MEAPESHPAAESTLEKIDVTLLPDEAADSASGEEFLYGDVSETEEPQWEESVPEETGDLWRASHHSGGKGGNRGGLKGRVLAGPRSGAVEMPNRRNDLSEGRG